MERGENITTINTMQYLTRLLKGNPEWRDEVRRELLTEELLQLPQRFAEYTKVTDKRLDNIEQKLDTLTGRVDTLADEVHTLAGRVDTVNAEVHTLTGQSR